MPLSWCLFFSTVFAQLNKNELALVAAPLVFDEATSYQMLYRRSLNPELSLRAGLRLFVDLDKETRFDTVTMNEGSFQYDLSFGLQRNLPITSLKKVYLYIATDFYYNSEFNRKPHETFYGYYWNMGLRPLAGISYEPFENIRLSFESQANFNVNLQEYSADGYNADRRFTFNPLDRLAMSIGYLF